MSLTILTRCGLPGRGSWNPHRQPSCFGRSAPVSTRALRVEGSTSVRAIGRANANGRELSGHISRASAEQARISVTQAYMLSRDELTLY
jgi:hypothetical protein